jgi:hypothetical protein
MKQFTTKSYLKAEKVGTLTHSSGTFVYTKQVGTLTHSSGTFVYTITLKKNNISILDLYVMASMHAEER